VTCEGFFVKQLIEDMFHSLHKEMNYVMRKKIQVGKSVLPCDFSYIKTGSIYSDTYI
jgi:hypothetical protein